MFVRAEGREERQELMTFLENNGYELYREECRSKDEILDGFHPIAVNLKEKSYQMMGNVTCAAAISVMKTTDELYKEFEK